jgi:hypothetical protein
VIIDFFGIFLLFLWCRWTWSSRHVRR